MGAPRLQRKTRPGDLPIRPGGRLRLWTRIQRRVAAALLPQQPRGWRSAPPRRSRASRALAFSALGLCVLAVVLMIVGLVAGGEPSELRAGPLAGGLQTPAAETARSRPAERARDRPARRDKRKDRRRPRAAAPTQPVRAGSAVAQRPTARQAPSEVRSRRGPATEKKPPRDRSPQPAQEAPSQGTPSAPPAPTTPSAQPTAPPAPPASTAPSAPSDGGGGRGNGNGPDASGPPGQRGR